jgi:hypothetical protein
MTGFWARTFAICLILAATNAWAVQVTPLPGSTPQQAYVKDYFPNPVGVRVTDDAGNPVAGYQMSFMMLDNSWPSLGSIGGVFNGLTFDGPRLNDAFVNTYYLMTDANGVAVLGPAHASIADTYNISFGGVTFQLTALPLTPVSHLEQVSTDGRVYLPGDPVGDFVVRAVQPDGSPLVNATVTFSYVVGSDFGFLPSATVTTDAQGLAAAPRSGRFGFGYGDFTQTATLHEGWPVTTSRSSARQEFKVTANAGGRSVNLQDMWWGGPGQNGWGVSMVQHGDTLFAVVFAYDDAGKPTWYAVPQLTFSGSMYTPAGSPYFAYDASKFIVGAPVANVKLGFADDQSASIVYSGMPTWASQEKAIAREDITGDSPSPITGLGDMWWGGPSQNGWGIAITEQFGALYPVWFTYDENGAATWFAMPTGGWVDSSTYAGQIYKTLGSPWMNKTYDPSMLRASAAGTYSLHFQDQQHAQFTYSLDGHAGTLELTRLAF